MRKWSLPAGAAVVVGAPNAGAGAAEPNALGALGALLPKTERCCAGDPNTLLAVVLALKPANPPGQYKKGHDKNETIEARSLLLL